MALNSTTGGFIGRDMAVDLGTANTLVYVRGRGVVLDLSGGAVSGLFNEPLGIFVYVLVVLAVVVPLAIARFRPPALLEHHDQEVS